MDIQRLKEEMANAKDPSHARYVQRIISNSLFSAVLAVSMFSIFGYAWNIPHFYTWGTHAMALNTAICFFILSLGSLIRWWE